LNRVFRPWLQEADHPLLPAPLSGELFKIRIPGLSVQEKIKIDRTSDPGLYLYKYPVQIENDILPGTSEGIVNVIDGERSKENQ